MDDSMQQSEKRNVTTFTARLLAAGGVKERGHSRVMTDDDEKRKSTKHMDRCGAEASAFKRGANQTE
jgi:hypothetical protein